MTTIRPAIKPNISFAYDAQRPLPPKVNVVVIGGGVVGSSAALTLARWKVPVLLIEKGIVAGEQSSRNWGWVRIQGRSRAEVPLMLASRTQWQQISGQADTDIGLRQCGSTYVATTEAELAQRAQFMAIAKEYQLDTRLLGKQELVKLLGPIAEGMVGGLYTASDCGAEPSVAVPAMARLAASLGAHVFEGCAARMIDIRGGRVTGVFTEHGRVACEQVILAGGAWSRTFLENHGIHLAQLGVISSVQRTGPVDFPYTSSVGAPGVSIRQRLDGGVTIGRTSSGRFDLIPAALRHFKAFLPVLRDPERHIRLRAGGAFFGPLGHQRWTADQVSPFEKVRVLNPTPETDLLDDVLRNARQTFPELSHANVIERWAGMIDVMPDELPVIDRVAKLPGLTLATGFSGHGFGLGPGAGLLAAQLAVAREPVVDPAAFALARFDARS